MIFKNCFFITTREVNDDYRIPLENLQNLNVGYYAIRRLFGQISKKNTNLFNIIMHIIWCEGSIDHL